MNTHADPIGPIPAGEDPVEYDRLRRRVLWRFPSGLYLLGSRHLERRNLMTASFVTQLCLSPKIVGVGVERTALTHELVHGSGCFTLSLVARADRALVRRFVKPAVHDAVKSTLNDVHFVDSRVTGAPIVDGALAYVDCRVTHELDLGSHTLFAGEVVDAGSGQGGEEGEVLRMEDTRMSYGG
jgi:flavin reductase (DIM6/NTAB) family NADH-FMN oxidoreductase RutF